AAIEQSMLGAAHSCANPLTARFNVTHGVAIGVMLPHVLRWNAETCNDLYVELGEVGLNGHHGTVGERLAEAAAEMVRSAGLPTSLEACGVDRSALPALAEEAAQQWTAQFNPRRPTVGDFESLYQRAYNPP
ncbi:MAG: iron-containing alcohol dehydrogenase, partial [Planctomycetia bacterium]